MPGDISKNSFRRDNHYHSDRLQQGKSCWTRRWNEQVDIQSHRVEIESLDVIGPSGAPAANPGFLLTPNGSGDLTIGPGRYYVDGILCECEPQPRCDGQHPARPHRRVPTTSATYLAYLDVWREDRTAVEQPSLREVALGGPDTATRQRQFGKLNFSR